MRLRTALLSASILGLPICAAAQPVQGLYVSGGVGLNVPQDIRVNPLTPGLGPGGYRLDDGYGLDLTGAVGYGLGNGFRFELEGDWFRNGIRHLESTPFPTNASGRIRTYGAMANVLYDFDIGSPYVFPYLGLGAGYMWNKLDNVSFVTPGGGLALTADNKSRGRFAWQAIAGLSFPVPNMPGLSVLAQYRLLDVTGGNTIDGTLATPAGIAPARLSVGPQFSHTFLLGVRYAFNVTPPAAPAPAPAPVAAPAPAPARSYLVFFDWDSAALSDRARQIIREAAENAQRVQYTQIQVNGYTDTSGKPAYNQRLSIRRAQNVAAELVRDGVPRQAISIRGFGETHLLVPTGPGVREPQNRRVEIVIT